MSAGTMSLQIYLKGAHSGEANEGQCSLAVFTQVISETVQQGQVPIENEALKEALEDDAG